MILFLINMISVTSIVTQLFVLIMYSLGVLFYNYNKTVSSSQMKENHSLHSEESVEYFSEGVKNDEDLNDTSFINYDDYSAFANTSKVELKPIETQEQSVNSFNESSIENTAESTTDIQKTLEGIKASEENEDYVVQNSVLIATIEDDDFEQITFNLQSEQENSITMATDEDIIKVFQKSEPNDWAVRIPKTHN